MKLNYAKLFRKKYFFLTYIPLLLSLSYLILPELPWLEQSKEFSSLFSPYLFFLSLSLSLFLSLSFAILIEDSSERKKYREEIYSQKKKVAFSIRYRKAEEEENKTIWELKNVGNFTWNDGRMLIERMIDEKKETKIYPIRQIAPDQTVHILSDFPLHLQARWRVMIVVPEGSAVDLADFWEERAFIKKQ